jgi:hypothetical protein
MRKFGLVLGLALAVFAASPAAASTGPLVFLGIQYHSTDFALTLHPHQERVFKFTVFAHARAACVGELSVDSETFLWAPFAHSSVSNEYRLTLSAGNHAVAFHSGCRYNVFEVDRL